VKYVFYFLFLILIFSCRTQNVLYTDYILVEKIDGSKDTLTHKYWNRFIWDEYKMEWFIKTNNLNVEHISSIDLLYTTKQRFTKKQLGK